MPSISRTAEMIVQSAAGRAKKKKKADPAGKAARIAAYEARNAALAAQRAKVGNNLALAAIEAQQAQQAQQASERAHEEAKARAFVESVLNGPHGAQARRFIGLKGVSGGPCKVALVLRNWRATQGF